jgi:DNA-binding Lrp family transcriptional regulator
VTGGSGAGTNACLRRLTGQLGSGSFRPVSVTGSAHPPPGVLAPWGFEERDERVYRAVLRNPGTTVDVLAAEAGVDPDEVLRIARKLIRGRLVRRRGDGVVALRPDIALETLAREAELELARRREELDLVEATVAQFDRDYAQGEHDRGAPQGVDVVTGRVAVEAAVRRLATGHAGEVLCMLARRGLPPPDGAAGDRAAGDPAAGDRAAGDAGAGAALTQLCRPSRTLCAPGADRRGLAGTVRIAARPPTTMLVFAGRAAVLPTDGVRRSADEVLVVHTSALVAALSAVFELAWERATPAGRAAGPELRDDTLLRLLATGSHDDAVASEVGVSVRTVRRRVADLLEELGGRTRFQAGVNAARSGLL